MKIGDIKRLASSGKSPYFFAKDTMEFFQSQVFPDVKEIKDSEDSETRRLGDSETRRLGDSETR